MQLVGVFEQQRPDDLLPHDIALRASSRHRSMEVSYVCTLHRETLNVLCCCSVLRHRLVNTLATATAYLVP